MFGRVWTIVPVSLLAACAASGPETALTSPVASAIRGDEKLIAGDDFYAMKAPAVPKTAVVAPLGPGTGIVCRNEQETGTHITKHVCRSAVAIQARKERDQEMVQEWRRRALR